MNSQKFRELTHEVPVFIDINPKFTAIKTISTARTKRAVSILIKNGYDAKVSKFDKRYIQINHNQTT